MPREITIDPREGAGDEEKILLDLLLKQNDEKKRKRLEKTVKSEEKTRTRENIMRIAKRSPYKIKYKKEDLEIDLMCSLVKFKDGYYVINDEKLAGTQISKVKEVPIYYYKMGSDHKYHAEQVSPAVIKILKLSRNSPIFKLLKNIYLEEFKEIEQEKGNEKAFDFLWQKYVETAVHEHQMLVAAGDRHAEIVVDDTNHTIYVKSSKAPGKSLDKYLAAHPGLTFNQRLHLIKLVKNAIQDLHDKNIGHLDLKLENIFYDEATDQIRIIDYGSSQNIKEASQASTLAERGLPNYRHATTPWLDPKEHNQNTPSQIDSYSFAGVCGLILSDWREQKEWYELPLFKTKSENAGGRPRLDDEKPRHYEFSELEKASYLSENEKPQMTAMVGALKQLGHEDKDSRATLQIFEMNLLENVPTYKELPSIIMTTPLQDLDKELFQTLTRKFSFLLTNEDTETATGKSEKPRVKYLFDVLNDAQEKAKCHMSMKKILEDAISESIEKQKTFSSKFFNKIPRVLGSNVLGELLSLPPEVKKYLDPTLLEEAHKYSENLGMRVVHGIHAKVGKALTKSKG